MQRGVEMKDSKMVNRAYSSIERELKSVASVQLDATLTFEQKLIRCIDVYCGVRSRHCEAFDRVFLDLALNPETTDTALSEQGFNEGVVQPWRVMIKQGMVRGEIRQMPVELLLNYFLVFLQGFITLSEEQRQEWLEAGEIYTLLLEGIKNT